jgi:hypothetical protein
MVSFSLWSVAVRADDGILSWGGNPHLLHGETTVRMASEHVEITIKKKGYHGTVFVDAKFVFQNTGGPCDVRIGFPDKGEGALETEYGLNKSDALDKHEKVAPFSALEDFQSWVDGQHQKTEIVDADSKDEVASWHVKVVHFGDHQKRVIRDSYDEMLGGGATNSWYNKLTTVYIWEAAYEMDTGASWKGPIGKATVVVNAPFRVRRVLRVSPREEDIWNRIGKGTMCYSGFAKPHAHGHTLIFTRSNFKPDISSDIHVYWPIPGGRGSDGEDYANPKYWHVR